MTQIVSATSCALLILLVVSPASAQIVNTLRGFDDAEAGWSGGIETGVAMANGNTDYFEFQLDGAVQYQGASHRWRLLGRNQRRTAFGEEIAESRLLHLRHNYRLTRWLASIAFLQGQYEPFKRIQTRLLAGAGARVDLAAGIRWHTAVGAAVMLEHEELTGPLAPVSDDVRFSFFATVFRDVTDGVDIDVVAFYQPRVDDVADCRADVAASLRVDIVGELYAFFRYNTAYDSRPAPGVDDLDQNLRGGLGYGF